MSRDAGAPPPPRTTAWWRSAMVWSSRGSAAFADLVERATSALLPAGSEDIALNLDVGDQVRSRAVPPHEAMLVLKRRLAHPNPNVKLLALGLTDLCIKNGGDHFLAEVASPEFMDTLEGMVQGSNVDVRAKLLRCLQDWRCLAEAKPEMEYILQVCQRLEQKGEKFPPPDPTAVAAARAMAETLTAPEWTDGAVCTRCRTEFGTFIRKHHCRNCGRVFCYQCTGKTMSLPWFGIGQDVRVCEGCFARKGPVRVASKPATEPPPPPPQKPNAKEREAAARVRASKEDQDLEHAIRLSLQEAERSKAGPAAASAGEPQTESHMQGRQVEGTDTEDTELAAAIAASLRDMGPSREAAVPPAAGPSQPAAPRPSAAVRPSLELEPRDVDHVLTFAQTVSQPDAPWKRQLATDGVPRPVQNMFEKASGSRFKVARNLDEGSRRLRNLVEMHEKLTSAVRMYDQLLDVQVSGSSYGAPAPAREQPAAPREPERVPSQPDGLASAAVASPSAPSAAASAPPAPSAPAPAPARTPAPAPVPAAPAAAQPSAPPLELSQPQASAPNHDNTPERTFPVMPSAPTMEPEELPQKVPAQQELSLIDL